MKYIKRILSVLAVLVIFAVWEAISTAYAFLVSPFLFGVLCVYYYVKDGNYNRNKADEIVNATLDFMFVKPVDICEYILERAGAL